MQKPKADKHARQPAEAGDTPYITPEEDAALAASLDRLAARRPDLFPFLKQNLEAIAARKKTG